MNFHAWLNIIDDLFEIDDRHTGHRPEWTTISDELRGLNDTRVQLAHHTVWGKSDKGKEFGLKPGRYDARTKSKKYAPLKSDEIIAFIQQIGSVDDKLKNLLIKIDGQPPSESIFSNVLASGDKSAPPPAGLLEGDALSHPIPEVPEVPPQSFEAKPPAGKRRRPPRKILPKWSKDKT